jgi:hypothetical protein
LEHFLAEILLKKILCLLPFAKPARSVQAGENKCSRGATAFAKALISARLGQPVCYSLVAAKQLHFT